MNAKEKTASPRSALAVHFLPSDFEGFRLSNLAPGPFPAAALEAVDPRRAASLESPELPAAFPFDQLLLSASVQGAPFSASVKVRTAAGWSPWFSFGRFEPGRSASAPAKENTFGKVDTDILKLARKAAACRYRLEIEPSADPARLRCAAVCCTDSTLPYVPPARGAREKRLELKVPSLSQMAQKVAYAKDICSPTSVAMALRYLGAPAAPVKTAALARDYAAGLYGNWFFNTAYAGSLGYCSVLARLNSLEEARALLEAGAAVAASVTFGPGELRGAPLKQTRGHLLVLAGFTPAGDVIVRDPAAPSAASVRRVYRRADFARAWLGNKFGLAYVAAKDFRGLLAVKAPVTELYARPAETAEQRRRHIETQLVFNERVRLLGLAGPWARVQALEQPSLKDNGRRLAPYTGWLRAADLGFSLPRPHAAVVKSKTARAGAAELSMGVKLSHPAAVHGRHLHRLPSSGGAALRGRVLASAREFLGDKYYWGGRSAWGVDCSGLVNIAHRAWGVDLPRNAGDQLAVSRPVQPAALRPGDLIFSAKASRPKAIDHVMLYAGRGRLIEATMESGSVREITFEEKFGVPLGRVRNGSTAGTKVVYFGRVLE